MNQTQNDLHIIKQGGSCKLPFIQVKIVVVTNTDIFPWSHMQPFLF